MKPRGYTHYTHVDAFVSKFTKLHFQPVQLQVARVVRLCVFASSDGWPTREAIKGALRQSRDKIKMTNETPDVMNPYYW